MVAAVLHALGVYLGEWEDLWRGGAFESRALMAPSEEVQGAEIERRNAAYGVWGFKNPYGASVVRRAARSVREPYFVAVFRDPAAVTAQLQRRGGGGWEAHMPVVVERYAALVAALREARRPTLWVSYDKVLRFPHRFVEQLAAFVGVEMTAGVKVKARKRILTGDGLETAYLNLPRTGPTP